MSKFSRKQLDEALDLLGEIIAAADRRPQHFVVCGGSSLLALELVSRTATRDVDILASLQNCQLVQAKPLPGWLVSAAQEVQVELNLPENWFNTGPTEDTFFRFGFPEGLEGRLTTKKYGPALTISFISRYDQIFFKLYAAVDTGPGRHYTDLVELNPAEEELLAAANWTRRHDPSAGFLLLLKQVLEELGYGKLAERL
jgi:hypothetical protein